MESPPASDPETIEVPAEAAEVPRTDRPDRPTRGRLAVALLLSLLAHALLVTIEFGGEDFGVPGFAFPWQDRRGEAPELRVVLAPLPTDVIAAAAPTSTGSLPKATMER